MVAVPEVRASVPTGQAAGGRLALLAHCHRVVAVVDTAVELLRPESDLLRAVAGVEEVDVLVAVDDGPLPAPDESEVDGHGYAEADAYRAEIRTAVERLGRPGLRLHHLALQAPLSPRAEPDLVAALSELVGFDPEPGVYCLAPQPAPADANRPDTNRSVLGSAACRIAQVYGLPLLRYRCLELAVVPEQRPSADR
jgi:hypothetical protein